MKQAMLRIIAVAMLTTAATWAAAANKEGASATNSARSSACSALTGQAQLDCVRGEGGADGRTAPGGAMPKKKKTQGAEPAKAASPASAAPDSAAMAKDAAPPAKRVRRVPPSSTSGVVPGAGGGGGN